MRTLAVLLLTTVLSAVALDTGSATTTQPIKVIGAGLGRTGTSSLVVALTQLGYKPYHMKEGVFECGHVAVWADLARAKAALAAAPSGDAAAAAKAALRGARNALLGAIAAEGFNATTDFPASAVFDDLLEAFPEARVVLGVRKSGAAWATSVSNTIGRVWPLLFRRPLRWWKTAQLFGEVNEWMWQRAGVRVNASTGELDFASLAPAHDAWIEHVRMTVPAERLLVHSAKDGFAPLCAFLGVAAADCPVEYPWVNDSAELETAIGGLEIVLEYWVLITVSLVGLVVATVGLLTLRFCCKSDDDSEAGAVSADAGKQKKKTKKKKEEAEEEVKAKAE
jgi:hypothetical protein